MGLRAVASHMLLMVRPHMYLNGVRAAGDSCRGQGGMEPTPSAFSFLPPFMIGASNLLNSSYVVSSGSLTGPSSGADVAVDPGSLGLNSVLNILIVWLH